LDKFGSTFVLSKVQDNIDGVDLLNIWSNVEPPLLLIKIL
jgi:hypothetical protein